MKLLLPYFIIFIVVIQFRLRKNSRKHSDNDKAFWAREQEANATRRKNIEALPYITLPDTLPLVDSSDPEICRAQEALVQLKDKKILNLTGKSNTDLKMLYGAANLPLLTEYDDNFTALTRAVVDAGRLLIEKGFEQEGVAVLEFGISCQTDLTLNYTLLAAYYLRHNEPEKMSRLTETANRIESLSKPVILKKLADLQLTAHTETGSGQ